MKLSSLNRTEYQAAQTVYKDNAPIRFPIIQGVLASLQGGDIFVDESRKFFFVIHKFGFCQLFHRTYAQDKLKEFCELIAEPHFCQGRKLRWYNPDTFCLEYFNNSKTVSAQLSERTQMRVQGRAAAGLCDLPFAIAPITADSIEKLTFDLDIGNRFWDSLGDLLKFGIGVGAFEGDKCIGTCYSASLVENVAEIDIFVDERYRKSGIGKSLVKSFIQQCQARGVIPNWDCFTNNIPSLSLANSMGFSSEYVYPFLTIYK